MGDTGKGFRALLGEGNGIRSRYLKKALIELDRDIGVPSIKAEEELMRIFRHPDAVSLEGCSEVDIGQAGGRCVSLVGEPVIEGRTRGPVEGYGPDAAVDRGTFGNLVVESITGHFNKPARTAPFSNRPASLRGEVAGIEELRVQVEVESARDNLAPCLAKDQFINPDLAVLAPDLHFVDIRHGDTDLRADGRIVCVLIGRVEPGVHRGNRPVLDVQAAHEHVYHARREAVFGVDNQFVPSRQLDQTGLVLGRCIQAPVRHADEDLARVFRITRIFGKEEVAEVNRIRGCLDRADGPVVHLRIGRPVQEEALVLPVNNGSIPGGVGEAGSKDFRLLGRGPEGLSIDSTFGKALEAAKVGRGKVGHDVEGSMHVQVKAGVRSKAHPRKVCVFPVDEAGVRSDGSAQACRATIDDISTAIDGSSVIGTGRGRHGVAFVPFEDHHEVVHVREGTVVPATVPDLDAGDIGPRGGFEAEEVIPLLTAAAAPVGRVQLVRGKQCRDAAVTVAGLAPEGHVPVIVGLLEVRTREVDNTAHRHLVGGIEGKVPRSHPSEDHVTACRRAVIARIDAQVEAPKVVPVVIGHLPERRVPGSTGVAKVTPAAGFNIALRSGSYLDLRVTDIQNQGNPVLQRRFRGHGIAVLIAYQFQFRDRHVRLRARVVDQVASAQQRLKVRHPGKALGRFRRHHRVHHLQRD